MQTEKSDTERLNWLIQNSALDNSEGSPIVLVVTTQAVAKCFGTHLPEYRNAVLDFIDARMPPNDQELSHRRLATSTAQRN
jgi:hypothetical protein